MNISLKSLLLCEDPDDIFFGEINLGGYYDSHVVGIFSIFDTIGHWIAYHKPTGKAKSNVEGLEGPTDEVLYGKTLTHGTMLNPAASMGIVSRPDRDEAIINGRMWKIMGNAKDRLPPNMEYALSFWEEYDKVTPFEKQILDILSFFQVDPKKIYFEFIDKLGRWFSYAESFGSKEVVSQEKSLSPEIIKQLQKIQHLSPEVKKFLIKTKPNFIEMLSDKMSIPPIKLKYMLGMGMAETTFDFDDDNSLSYSDYFHPSIPGDVKPAYSLRSLHEEIKIGPEDIEYDGDFIDYWDAKYVFVFFKDGNDPHFTFLNNNNGMVEFDDGKTTKNISGVSETHTAVIETINRIFGIELEKQYNYDTIHGRVWIEGMDVIVGFWNDEDNIRKFPNFFPLFEKMMSNMGISLNRVSMPMKKKGKHYTTDGKIEAVSYQEFKLGKNRPEKKEPSEKSLAYKLHLMSPDEKKKYLQQMGVSAHADRSIKKAGGVPDFMKQSAMSLAENKKLSLKSLVNEILTKITTDKGKS